jgi:type II secretory pathway pseudopilin PulG
MLRVFKKNGFSLIEIVSILAVIGVLTLSITSLMQNTNLFGRNTNQNSDFDNLNSLLNLALGNSATCASVFNTPGALVFSPSNLQTNGPARTLTNLTLPGTTSAITAGKSYGYITISSLAVSVNGNLTVNGTASNIYSANLTIQGKKTSGAAQSSLGGQYLNRAIPLQLEVNSSGTLISCAAVNTATFNQEMCLNITGALWNGSQCILPSPCKVPNNLISTDSSGAMICVTPFTCSNARITTGQNVLQGLDSSGNPLCFAAAPGGSQ